mgnify:CR=1 FL=1
MIALKLTNVKACMSHLLLMDTFDSFLLIEGEIMTFNTFKIDGFIQKNFYTSEELEQMGTLPEYAYWKQLREYCFSLIKEKDSTWISFCIQSVSEKYCPPYRAE